MNLQLLRFSDQHECTTSVLLVDGLFACFTLEDRYRQTKVAGQTRIPDGAYAIDWRKVETAKTADYRKRFDFFRWHLQLQKVPGFDFVYIHCGNTDADTEGCILVGDTLNNNAISRGLLGQSSQAYARIYQAIQPRLDARESVTLTIRSIEHGI